MKIPAVYYILLCPLLFCGISFAQQIKILTNQIGYEQDAAKRAVILGHDNDAVTALKVINNISGKEIASAALTDIGKVDQWKDWHFWQADFSAINDEGNYLLECQTNQGAVHSFPFVIQHDLLERNTLSDVIYYFKGQRCSGLFDKADHNLKFEDAPGTVDLHGGWYDATGDYGKHLSHLSYSNYFNPQQIPFTAWCLFKASALLTQRDTSPEKNFRQYKRRLFDEAIFGADYLVRSKTPTGSFYRSVDAPGGEKSATDRFIAKEKVSYIVNIPEPPLHLPPGVSAPTSKTYSYEVGYRNGGGLAIAALAVAGTFKESGDFSNAQYLKTAEDAFDFLEKTNLQYTKDGKENIIDDYCVLMAATELFKATKSPAYQSVADQRARNLLGRLISSGKYTNYWRADDGDRPFFHAADAGLPVVSLLNYYDIADTSMQPKILDTVRKSLESEMRTTDEVPNPFGYARQLVQNKTGERGTTFFFPHDTETAPWWQGENARLGSLASAARMAAPHFKDDPAFAAKLQSYAWNQLNWILGLNPYAACMLQGSGRSNIPYMFIKSYEYTNAPGGICNGISAGIDNPRDIDFDLGYASTGRDDDWRWGEQWLPHASWYLLAVSLGH